MAVIETGSNTAWMANVDAGYNQNVTLPQVQSFSGYARPLGEVDVGRVTGSAYLLAPETSEDFRMRSELDSILDSHVFNETAQATGKFKYYNTTMTATFTGNAVNTNASGITTANSGVLIQTQQYFPIFGGAQTYSYFNVAFGTTWAVTNTTVDQWLFTATITAPYAPTDGVYIRQNNTGIFGVANFNGTEQTTTPFVVASGGAAWTPTLGTFYDVIVTTGQNICVFWMDLRDGNGYTRMGSLSNSVGGGMPSSLQYVPFSIRHAIGGIAASAVMTTKVGTYTISQGGYQNMRSEQITATVLTGWPQWQQGHTQGTLGNYTNSLAPTAGVALTNTTSASNWPMFQIWVLPTLAVNTDGIVMSYQNPAPTATIAGKIAIIKGIWVESIVTTVLVGWPIAFVWSIGYGASAVSLATAEGANTKAPRRIPLGIQQFAAAAAVNTQATRIHVPFDRPLPLMPWEFLTLNAKNIGTVTTTGVITCMGGADIGFIL